MLAIKLSDYLFEFWCDIVWHQHLDFDILVHMYIVDFCAFYQNHIIMHSSIGYLYFYVIFESCSDFMICTKNCIRQWNDDRNTNFDLEWIYVFDFVLWLINANLDYIKSPGSPSTNDDSCPWLCTVR